jgi:hypothetical protein
MSNQKLVQGQKVFFTNENLPYNVMAVSERYAVVSRKLDKKEDDDLLQFQVKRGAYSSKQIAFYSLKESPVYSLLDFQTNEKAPHNLVFGIMDYFDEEDCEKCINLLEKGEVKLSRRYVSEISIDWVRTNSK